MAIGLGYRYGTNDAAFFEMLEKSTEDSATRSIAIRIQDGYVKLGINANVTPYSMLQMLHLQKYDHNVLRTPRFKLWVKYVTTLHKTFLEEAQMVAMAKAMARTSDDDFLMMLDMSTKDPATTELAIKLQDGWIESKVKQAGVPTDEVINHVLKLITLDDNVLSSPRFMAYFELLKRKHDTNDDGLNLSMAIGLGYRYGTNDAAFFEMLEKSTEDSATRSIAIRIQDGYVKLGINANVTPYSMLQMLHLQKYDHNVLRTPRFKLWVKYVTTLHKTFLEEAQMVAMAKAMARTSDDDFLMMLDMSTKDPATTELAIKLQDGWIESKVKQAGVPTDEVINHVLKLITLDDNVLSSPRFMAYFELLKRKHGTNVDDLYVRLADGLWSRYGTNDAAFLMMLKISKEASATEELATKLESRWKKIRVNKREYLPMK
ncbi:unnamed protein product [Peronospora farinosa]|nr:unnamed protein product [Peronospora farinosa]